MTEAKQCSLCYWWDAAPAEPGGILHRCYSTAMGGTASTGNYCCDRFRRAKSSDPATLWNRKRCGRDTEKRGKVKDPAAVKRGKSSKKKGKRREKEGGELVCAIAGGRFYRQGDKASHRDAEFVGNCFEGVLHMEVKGRKAFSFTQYCKQAEQDAATHGLSRWIVAAKADREPWRAITDLTDYIRDQVELAEFRRRNGGPLTMQELRERRAKDEAGER
jgi:hypothetical protein